MALHYVSPGLKSQGPAQFGAAFALDLKGNVFSPGCWRQRDACQDKANAPALDHIDEQEVLFRRVCSSGARSQIGSNIRQENLACQ